MLSLLRFTCMFLSSISLLPIKILFMLVLPESRWEILNVELPCNPLLTAGSATRLVAPKNGYETHAFGGVPHRQGNR